MTHYLADSIYRLESGAGDETAFDDSVAVFASRANTVRGLDAAKYVGGPTVRGINRDTVLSAQAADGYCQEVVKALNAGRHISNFKDPDGVLGRRAAPDGAHQGVVPPSLQERVLHVEHDATVAGHPGESRMYAAMRRFSYWVGMAADVVSYVRMCESCARQRVRPLGRRSPLTLFPATMLFQDTAVDLYAEVEKPTTPQTGVTGPEELLNRIQHSPQLHSDQEPFLNRLEIANLQFPSRPRNPGASRGLRACDICEANRECWAHNLLRSKVQLRHKTGEPA